MQTKIVLPSLLLALLLIATPVTAQNVVNAGNFFAAYPEGGSWFAMDDSSTGFFFDIQNGHLAGSYFGFDDDGNDIWLIFNGPLQALFDLTSPEVQIGWQLESDLNRISNGACIVNCTGNSEPSVEANSVADLFIRFDGRSRGKFSVDGSSLVDIIPLYFGNPAIISDQPAGLTAQPDLQGTWVVAVGNGTRHADLTIAEVDIAQSSAIIEIGEQTTSRPPVGVPPADFVSMLTQAPVIRDTAGLFPDGAVIECSYLLTTQTNVFGGRIECFVNGTGLNEIDAATGAGIRATAPIQMMSDSRFIINLTETTNASPASSTTRIEAFRISYD